MKFEFKKLAQPKTNIAVYLISEKLELSESLKLVNNNDCIKKALKADNSFKAKSGETLTIIAPGCSGIDMIILLGIGKAEKLDSLELQNIGGTLATKLNSLKQESASIVIDEITKAKVDCAEIANNLASGIKLKNYSFNKYFNDKKSSHKLYLNNITLLLEHYKEAKELFTVNEQIIEGTILTRDLVSEPANVLYPESFANKCKELKKLGIDIKVLKEKDLVKLKMNALLGVGQGSDKESFVVVMQWNGGKKKEQPLAFIGKGVCFDTGGISLKPSANMGDMKYDMGGAGVVTGLMRSLAGRKAKVNAIGVIGLVENMPSGSAQRPGDVVTTMSGQTVEVDNTDAEGRLVLADVLWYTQDKYKPKLMINLATLTGAVVVALGDGHAGLMSNNDKLAEELLGAGKNTGELLWRLPLSSHYDKQINSQIADIKNVGQGRGAGTITAGQFLQRFVNKCTWAHIDIAGMTWLSSGTTKTCPKGATGFGVRLLDNLVSKYYE